TINLLTAYCPNAIRSDKIAARDQPLPNPLCVFSVEVVIGIAGAGLELLLQLFWHRSSDRLLQLGAGVRREFGLFPWFVLITGLRLVARFRLLAWERMLAGAAFTRLLRLLRLKLARCSDFCQ